MPLIPEGIRIVYQHFRMVRPANGSYKPVLVRYQRNLLKGLRLEVMPRGGKTACMIIAGDQVFRGEANCYYKDTFSYKAGRAWALKKALELYWAAQ
jgi:hypothetical protein